MTHLRIPPPWLAMDKKVLRFRCYFQEAVPDSPTEAFRYRKCVLCYFLEDDTISISEPTIPNSGLMQGTIVARTKTQYRVRDLKCGAELTLFAINYRLTEADGFTVQYYASEERDLGTPEPLPTVKEASETVAPHHQEPLPPALLEAKQYTELLFGGQRVNKKCAQWLQNDRKVLRFFCFWNDESRGGLRVFVTVHFFLADDSVEVIETGRCSDCRGSVPACNPGNSCTSETFVMYKKAPLKKGTSFASPSWAAESAECYKAEDFLSGFVLLGRKIELCDCDEFTRNYFGDSMGPAKPLHVCNLAKPVVHAPPKPVELSALAKQIIFSDKALRFTAKMLCPQGDTCDHANCRMNAERNFIITYFLANDEFQVFEQPTDGFMSGLWAQRERREFLTVESFKVKQKVKVNGSIFLLDSADAFTENWNKK